MMALVNICPDVPDDWAGGRSETARLLGIDPKTLDRYTSIGKRDGGIGWRPRRTGKGKTFLGKDIKRFWHSYR